MPDQNSLAATLTGLALGLAAVLMWGAYMTYAKAGVLAGLQPIDFAFLRYMPAGLICLPFLFRSEFRNPGWTKGLAITLFAGPVFVLTATGGYLFAPLSHGAVIQPSTAAISGMFFGWLILRETVNVHRLLGLCAILTGILMLALAKPLDGLLPGFWMGDILFVSSGLCWTAYTILLRRWELGPMQATAIISVLSAVIVVPPYLLFVGFGRLLTLPAETLVTQFAIHGIGAGVLAMVAYAGAAQLLGAGRAALFPALVPPTAVMLGIPVAGIWPSFFEWLGALFAALGLIVAIGLFARRRKTVPVAPAGQT